MKKFMKQLVPVVLFILAVAMAMPVQASARTVTKKLCLTYYPGTGKKYREMNENCFFRSEEGKKYSIKSSRPSVVSVKRERLSYGYAYPVICRKPGHATVTLKWGKNKYITKITVKKFVNPVKSFKIGKKTYGSKQFNKWHKILKNTPKGRQKIKIKLKSGWKLGMVYVESDYQFVWDVNIYFPNYFDVVRKEEPGLAFGKKNGSYINMRKYKGFHIYAYNKKTKQPIKIIIDIK